MRVLMTTDTVGGVWTYALDLVRALPEITFDLATMGALPSCVQQTEASLLSNLRLHAGDYRLEWMPDPWDDLARASDWLLALERDTRPDIVHFNGYVHAALPFRAPVITVGHSDVLSWWRAVRGEDAPADWDRYAEAVRAGLAASDCIVAPTETMRCALKTHYGPLPPSRVIANSRAPGHFCPQAKQPFILSAGRLWDDSKNIGALADAAPGLPWPVCVAGESTDPQGGESAFPNVRLLGLLPPEEMAYWMARAAVYTLPARYEPFGLSVLEAALSGCALVLGDIPSLREVWGDAALFVPTDDTKRLHETLAQLCRDEAMRTALGQRALLRAAQYTPARMALAYRELYEEVGAK